MFQKLRTDLTRKLRLIRLLMINADGLITESGISYYTRNSALNDGHEIRALKELGVEIVAFSTKGSEEFYPIISRLGIESFHRAVSQKSVLYYRLKVKHSISDDEIAFIGGDFSDLSIIERVSFPVATADAPLEVRSRSYYVTYGVGEEAVREVAKLILRAKNHSNGLSE